MKRNKRKFAAVILAAGYSSRMKTFKPLLHVGETTALEGLLAALNHAGIHQITVVTGHERGKLQPIIAEAGATETYNDEFDNGMFSSIKKGLQAGSETYCDASGFFLMPVDCPLISDKTVQKLMEQVEQQAWGDDFYVPVFEGKKGHPLYIPRVYVNEILNYDGPGGLKGITDKYWDKMIRVPVNDEGCVMDMDTPESYQEILDFVKAGRMRENLQQLAAGKRIFLVRHGETQQHQEKMFIGQYDVPLNDKGRMQAKRTAEEIVAAIPKTGRVYVSPLQRAAETARILKYVFESKLHSQYELCEIDGFKEINLGDWDGMPIREVKEKYPVEYQRRGSDIFTFKIGNKAENFYDVQYRAIKALRKILKDDASEDIVIVSHSAVIRALENNLRGLRVNDEWQKIEKGMYCCIE